MQYFGKIENFFKRRVEKSNIPSSQDHFQHMINAAGTSVKDEQEYKAQTLFQARPKEGSIMDMNDLLTDLTQVLKDLEVQPYKSDHFYHEDVGKVYPNYLHELDKKMEEQLRTKYQSSRFLHLLLSSWHTTEAGCQAQFMFSDTPETATVVVVHHSSKYMGTKGYPLQNGLYLYIVGTSILGLTFFRLTTPLWSRFRSELKNMRSETFKEGEHMWRNKYGKKDYSLGLSLFNTYRESFKKYYGFDIAQGKLPRANNILNNSVIVERSYHSIMVEFIKTTISALKKFNAVKLLKANDDSYARFATYVLSLWQSPVENDKPALFHQGATYEDIPVERISKSLGSVYYKRRIAALKKVINA